MGNDKENNSLNDKTKKILKLVGALAANITTDAIYSEQWAMASCTSGDCGCCSGCSGHCSGDCQYSCGSSCNRRCNGCTGSCKSNCTTACATGCNGCVGACKSDCTSACDTGCNGCVGACKSDCAGCTGSCTSCRGCSSCSGCSGGCYSSSYADYVITLNNQGANISSGTTSVTVRAGNTMGSITPPRKNGYSFEGYFFEPNGKGKQYYTNTGASANVWEDFNNVSRTGSTSGGRSTATLYAKWSTVDYNIRYNLHGGKFKDDVVSHKKSQNVKSLKGRSRYQNRYNIESEPIVLEDAERKGMDFNGWKKNGVLQPK